MRVRVRIFLSVSLLVGASFFSVFATASGNQAEAAPTQQKEFYRNAVLRVGELAGTDAKIKERVDLLLAEADRICALPLITRVDSLEELRKRTDGRSGKVEGRVKNVEPVNKNKAELFALASADLDTTTKIFQELPLLAAAYRLTGMHAYKDRIENQLREVTKWQPLQRPGWTLYTPENDLPLSGNDGIWLSTGLGLTALVQTLQILEPGTLPTDLEASVRRQIETEVKRIYSDWEKQVPWFVRSKNVITNQWVTPSGGLVVAAAFLGRELLPEAYELGVSNLLATMDALGEDGSTSEGGTYGMQRTVPFLWLAARAALEAGDDRLASHPFLRNFPKWMSSFFQPGDYVINCFDGYDANRASRVLQLSNFSLLTVLSQDPSLIWLQRHVFGPEMFALDLYGLMSLAVPASAEKEPPLEGVFKRSAWVAWRNSWDDKASGVWIRGGDTRDFHDHNDRGHVNFIVNGKAVLIEAGTPGYEDPLKEQEFSSVKGHNVLQVDDELMPLRQPAAITVHRLDAQGGDVTVYAGAGYRDGTKRWQDRSGKSTGQINWRRHVVWDANRMVVTDHVTLNKPGKVSFRWHLGSEKSLDIAVDSETSVTASLPPGAIKFPGWIALPGQSNVVEGIFWFPPTEEVLETPSAKLQVMANQPISVREEKNLDHTLKFRARQHAHTTLLVESQEGVTAFEMQTIITSP